MFDIGWQELFIVGLVTIIVIGPKELPRVLRTVTLGIRKVRAMARDFQEGLDELAREADLADLRKEIEDGIGTDVEKEFESIADPAREVEQSVREIADPLDTPEPVAPTPAKGEGETPPAANETAIEPPAASAGGKARDNA